MASALIEKVLSCPSLPSLPAVAVEVLRVTRDPKARLADIAKIVSNDPSLSAKILKTVNSSLYGLKERCTRIDRALSFMGMNTVKSIVLGLSVVDSSNSVKDGNGFDLTRFWRKTIYSAAAARQIALTTQKCDPDEAFTAGLFQDIGVLASVTALKDTYAAAIVDARDPALLHEVESERLGFNHTEVGGELATRWSLPQQYVDCIRHHHAAQAYEGANGDLVRSVALAGFVADALSAADRSKSVARLRMYAERWFQLSPEGVESLLKTTGSAATELAKLFEKNVGESPDVNAIMAEARELSVEHQVAVQLEAEQLRQANQTLEHQTLTDTLTGVGNRRKFDTLIAESLAAADTEPSRATSVLFIDADKFKSINDTHGHPAGDAVLIELARRVSETVGERGLVCRFGGEEFAVLLPGLDEPAAESLGEAVRAAIAATPFDTSKVPGAPSELKVTISVGVATRPAKGSEGPLSRCSGEQLLKAADESVYIAKQSGRNRVHVAGRPRPEADSAAPPAHAARPEPAPEVASSSRAPNAPRRVMIVEDDPLAAALLRAVIQRQGNATVQVLNRADEAIAQIGKEVDAGTAPDVVLCDLNTGGLSGIEFVRKVRADARTARIPVILTSASAAQDCEPACLAAGASAFVSKTDLAVDLVRWVARIMDEAHGRRKAAA